MRLPRDISPGAASRRAFLADLLVALGLAALAILLAAGIGVVGFFALLTFVVLIAWIGIEAAFKGVWRRRGGSRRNPREGRGASGRADAGDHAVPPSSAPPARASRSRSSS